VDRGPLTAYQRIAHELRQIIINKDLAAGECIGTERELCERWQASRTTIRRALSELSDEGLLVSHQGAGWFVSEARVSQQLAQLEPLSEILPRYGETSHTVTAFRSVKPPSHVALALNLDSDATVLEVERVHTLKKQPIALTRIWLVDWVGSHLSLADAKAGPIFPALPGRIGVRIDNSNQTIRASGLEGGDAALMNVKAGSHALQVDRTCFTKEGEAIAVVLILYRADRFELRMSLKWADADTWQSVISPGIGLMDGI
jgi:DNA-binding GntR family transcriptional regulator